MHLDLVVVFVAVAVGVSSSTPHPLVPGTTYYVLPVSLPSIWYLVWAYMLLVTTAVVITLIRGGSRNSRNYADTSRGWLVIRYVGVPQPQGDLRVDPIRTSIVVAIAAHP